MHRGHFKIWRKIADNQSWSRGAVCRGLMLTLLQKANWKEGHFAGIRIEAGQFAFSGQALADELSINRRTLLRYLDILEQDGFITRTNMHKRFTLITIVNLHSYQGDFSTPAQPLSQLMSQGVHTKCHTIKEDKKVRINTPPTPKGESADFLAFWQTYPKRVGKDAASKAWAKRRNDMPEIKVLLSTLERQKQSDQWRKDGGQFIPNPATWINQGRWADGEDSATDTRPLWAANLGEIL